MIISYIIPTLKELCLSSLLFFIINPDFYFGVPGREEGGELRENSKCCVCNTVVAIAMA